MRIPDTYTFRWGEGQISGFLSALFGCLGLAAVLCYHFPEFLTFADLRQGYDGELLRWVLLFGLCLALVCGAINILIGRWRTLGAIGLSTAAVAALLGGATAQAVNVHSPATMSIGLDWFILDLLASAIIFIPIERIWALRREQPVLRPEWRLDLHYFAMTHLFVSVIIIASTAAVTTSFGWTTGASWQHAIAALPGWLQFVLILLVADLAQYWSHRLMHTIPWLWRFHAVHHSAPAMDWLASSRLHVIEVLITRTWVLAPVFILGFSPVVIMWYVVYVGLHGIFIHANVRFTFGPARHLIATPAFHHWHHSEDARALNTNYAIHYPWLDRLFGTYFCPRGEWPTSYGIGGEPIPAGILRQFLWPFIPRPRATPTDS